MPVLNDADELFLGDTPVDFVFAGEVQVWPIPAWSPSLDGLAIWLDASALPLVDGSPVDVWPNQGSAGLGTMYATPSPVVLASVLNGLPVVRFTSSQGRLRMVNTGVNHDYTIVFVGRVFTDSERGRLVSAMYPAANFLIGWHEKREGAAYDGVFWAPETHIVSPPTGNWKMYSAEKSTVDPYPKLYDNGVFTSQSAGGGYGWAQTFNISGYAETGTEETVTGEMAEVLIYNRRLTDAQRTEVEDYLRTKWGLP